MTPHLEALSYLVPTGTPSSLSLKGFSTRHDTFHLTMSCSLLSEFQRHQDTVSCPGSPISGSPWTEKK